VESLWRQQRHLRGMPDGNAPTPAEFLGLAADIFDLHPLRGLGKIEMHVNFGIELARDRKDAIDLSARVGVEIRHCANGPRAAAQALDQELLGAGMGGARCLRDRAEWRVP